MVAAHSGFWAQLDQQIAGSPQRGDCFTAEVIALPHAAETGLRTEIERTEEQLSDWTGVLDTLMAARSLAQSQEERLREQAASHEALIQGLRQEVRQIQEQVGASETNARAVKAQAEATAKQILEQAEARVAAIQLQADERVRMAEERARAALIRADAAESWLKRIERAAQDLVPNSVLSERVIAVSGQQDR